MNQYESLQSGEKDNEFYSGHEINKKSGRFGFLINIILFIFTNLNLLIKIALKATVILTFPKNTPVMLVQG